MRVQAKNVADLCVVLTTWPAGTSVEPFARSAVEARLAACVHVLDAGRSFYRWQGTLEQAAEHQVVIKTTRDQIAALAAFIEHAHPYAVAEFLVCDAEGSRAYATWVRESVGGDAVADATGG